jgi:cell division protease FtsH
MAWLMDQEIREMIIEAENKAKEILIKVRNVLDVLANALMKEEVLERDDIEKIIQTSNNL